MNVDKYQYNYFRNTLIAYDEDDLKNFHVSMVGDTHACDNGVFCAIIQIYHREENFSTEGEHIFTGILNFYALKGRRFMRDFIRLPEANANFNAVLCTNYHRNKRIEPTEVVCKKYVTADLYFMTVDRSGTFQISRNVYQGLALADNFLFKELFLLDESDQSNVRYLNVQTHVVTLYLLRFSSNQESVCKRVTTTMQQKESSIDFNLPPSTILLQNYYINILSLKFIDEDYLMMICACCVENVDL